jgi:hypothetical protein
VSPSSWHPTFDQDEPDVGTDTETEDDPVRALAEHWGLPLLGNSAGLHADVSYAEAGDEIDVALRAVRWASLHERRRERSFKFVIEVILLATERDESFHALRYRDALLWATLKPRQGPNIPWFEFDVDWPSRLDESFIEITDVPRRSLPSPERELSRETSGRDILISNLPTHVVVRVAVRLAVADAAEFLDSRLPRRRFPFLSGLSNAAANLREHAEKALGSTREVVAPLSLVGTVSALSENEVVIVARSGDDEVVARVPKDTVSLPPGAELVRGIHVDWSIERWRGPHGSLLTRSTITPRPQQPFTPDQDERIRKRAAKIAEQLEGLSAQADDGTNS